MPLNKGTRSKVIFMEEERSFTLTIEGTHLENPFSHLEWQTLRVNLEILLRERFGRSSQWRFGYTYRGKDTPPPVANSNDKLKTCPTCRASLTFDNTAQGYYCKQCHIWQPRE